MDQVAAHAQAHLAASANPGSGLDMSRLLPPAPPLEMQLAQAQAQAQSRGAHDDGNGGQASLPMWADRFALQWQRGQGGGGVAPWMQERVAQVVCWSPIDSPVRTGMRACSR